MKVAKNIDNLCTDEGWSIQVYGGDRRRLLTLDSTHIWMFFTGLVVGLLIAIAGFRVERSAPPQSQNIGPEPLSAPFALD